mgnify:FL=1
MLKNLYIGIDFREKEIISKLKLKLNENQDFIIESLPIGDIIIYKDSKPLIIIERKTVKDLAGSIKDGRYTEQSLRLSESSNVPNHNIYYLIEGSIEDFVYPIKAGRPISKQALYTSLCSLSYKKGFSILRSNSIFESIDILLSLFQRLQRDSSLYYNNEINNNEDSKTDYLSSIKIIKKHNITQQDIPIMMLTQIPGLSIKTAKLIINEFGSFNLLLEDIKRGGLKLDTIKIGDNDTKKRHISKNVIDYLKNIFQN